MLVDLKFAWLLSTRKVSDKTKKWIINSYRINKEIFNKNPGNKFKIIICNSEEEWKKESKYYYFPFGAGTVLRDGTLVIKEQKFLDRNDKNYKLLLDHEMNHVFFCLIYGLTKPTWIHEGLANFIGGYNPLSMQDTLKNIKEKNLDHRVLQYRYFYKNFSTKEKVKLNYSTWRYFIKFISNNRPRAIIKFVNDYIKKPTKSNYDRLFIEHFGKNPRNKFLDFIEWLEHS